MNILAIDPGPKESAIVEFDPVLFTPKQSAKLPNREVLSFIYGNPYLHELRLIVEQVRSYGMTAGAELFETCEWSGRFIEAHGGTFAMLPRLKVKMELCHDSRAKDANIRCAILDLFPRTGGGTVPQIGTKRQPGPLFGFAGDMWAALAVAIAGFNLDRQGKLEWQEA